VLLIFEGAGLWGRYKVQGWQWQEAGGRRQEAVYSEQ